MQGRGGATSNDLEGGGGLGLRCCPSQLLTVFLGSPGRRLGQKVPSAITMKQLHIAHNYKTIEHYAMKLG